MSKPTKGPKQKVAESQKATPHPPAATETPTVAPGSTALDTEDEFYAILAGGGRTAMLCALIDLGLDQLLAARGPLTSDEIATALGLHPVRGAKWLSLLETIRLVRFASEPRSDGGDHPVRYANGPLPAAFAEPSHGYFYREFLRYWRYAASHDVVAVLRGAKVPYEVRYPPQAKEDVALLHDWMRAGVSITLNVIEQSFDFSRVRRVLDVGGGDATMASEIAVRHPHLHLTVFNTPQAAELARANLAARNLGDRVTIVEGNFLTDELPRGFDLVMFSRVLADWPPASCERLLDLAWDSLDPRGALLVCEPFRDDNPDLSIAWEHSYLPYDDFGAYTYKTTAFYRRLLAKAGFIDIVAQPRRDTIHGTLVARRP